MTLTSLALGTIPDGGPRLSSDHRNNFAAIQTAANALLTSLGAGAAGQMIVSSGADFAFSGLPALADTSLSVGAAAIDIQNIPQTYSHLLVRWQLRGDAPADVVSATLKINNDGAAHYDYQLLESFGSSTLAGEGFGATPLAIAIPGLTAVAGSAANGFAYILNYTGTTFNKTVAITFDHKAQAATGQLFTGRVGGHWNSTAAINRLTFTAQSQNLVAGSRVTLYGWG
jgi:hypothetical protein